MVRKVDWLCFEFHDFPHINLVYVGGKYVPTKSAHLYCPGCWNSLGSALLSRELNNPKSIYYISLEEIDEIFYS